MGARSNWVGSDSANHRGVAKGGLGGDDAVGDVVVDGLRVIWLLSIPELYNTTATYRVLLLLDLEDSTVLEGPLDNVSVWGASLYPFTLAQGRVELGKVLQLDEVPDVTKRGLNDGRLEDRGGSGNARSHFVVLF